MINNMKISDRGINCLKQFEGYVKSGDKHVIYDDKTGKIVNSNKTLPIGATIGYGHLIKSGENFRNGISESMAIDLLRSDIVVAEQVVKNNILTPLSQNQYDALVVFAYNIGSENFAKSTVVKYVNNPNFHSSVYSNLESAWKAWNRYRGKISNGLINRRQREWNMYSMGIY